MGKEIIIETTVSANITDTIGDTFDKKTSKMAIKELINDHVAQWAREHGVSSRDVKILKTKIIPL
jgi:hypothetical protein